jgi:hypothetical protein
MDRLRHALGFDPPIVDKREPPWLVHDPSTPDDLFVEIGTCSPF